MLITGIDPSFTSTGVAIYDSTTQQVVESSRFTSSKIYEGHDKVHLACRSIVSQLSSLPLTPTLVIEYPALATPSGSYLAILNGYIASHFSSHTIVWLPPTAVNSFTHNSSHSKQFLVDYCKSRSLIHKRTSHDICTAIILCLIYQSILINTYKNKYFINKPQTSFESLIHS